MITGTVPPSTPQAAPVTYDGRRGAEEHGDARDLVGLRHPSERAAGRHLREHRVAIAAAARHGLVGEAARRRARPASATGPGQIALHEHAVLRLEVGHEPRQRQHGRLRDGVVGHARSTGACRPSRRRSRCAPGRTRAGAAAPRGSRARSSSTFRSSAACQSSSVELVERHLPGHADVVDEHVEAAQRRHRLGHGALRLAALREVGGDRALAARRPSPPRCGRPRPRVRPPPPAARRSRGRCPSCRRSPGRGGPRVPDPRGAAYRVSARHGAAAPPATRRDRLERRGPLAGAQRPRR